MGNLKFKYLTPEQQKAYEEGKMTDWQASMANQRNDPETENLPQYLMDIAPGLKERDPSLPSAVNNARSVAGSVLGAFTDPIGTLGSFAEGIHENIGKPAAKALADNEIFHNAVQAVAVPEGEVAAQKAQAAQSAADMALRDYQNQLARIGSFDALMGTDQPMGAAIIGPAGGGGGGGGYSIPAPPPGPDYSGVQAALDQTKPTFDEAEFESRRKGAILTGLLGGLLSASMDSDANFAQILGRGGLGVLQGMATADESKMRAKEKFAEAMNEYWIRSAGVRKDQAESDADYANRVWQTKVQQLAVNAQAAAARQRSGQSTIRQAGDKFFVEETVMTEQGPMRQLRPLDTGMINRAAGLNRHITQVLGGTPDAKQKADTIVAEVITRKDPAYALPMMTIAKLKTNGTYLDAIKFITDNDPEMIKVLGQMSSQATLAGMAEKETNAMLENRRDALLVSYFMHSVPFRQFALDKSGILSGDPAAGERYGGFN